MAAFNYLFNRVSCYPLTHNNKNNEMNIIKQIMYENGYNGKLMKAKKPTRNNIQEKNEQVKWAVFTYNGKQTRFVTKLFKDTNILELHLNHKIQ
jgi:L-cysteine desulfidase